MTEYDLLVSLMMCTEAIRRGISKNAMLIEPMEQYRKVWDDLGTVVADFKELLQQERYKGDTGESRHHTRGA